MRTRSFSEAAFRSSRKMLNGRQPIHGRKFSSSGKYDQYVVFVRHGESLANPHKKCSGQVDVLLSNKGIEQAQTAAQILKNNNLSFDGTYSSQLMRAFQTAKIISPNDLIVADRRLNERSFGKLAWTTKKEAAKILSPEEYDRYINDPTYRPPAMDYFHPCHPDNPADVPKVIGPPYKLEGESFKDVENRLKPFINEILIPRSRGGKKTLMVAHSQIGGSLIPLLEGSQIDRMNQRQELLNGQPMFMRFSENSVLQDVKPLEINPPYSLSMVSKKEPKRSVVGRVRIKGISDLRKK